MVVYFDWKTVIYIYACGKCRTQFMLPMEKSVTFTGACANGVTCSPNIFSNSNITSFFRFVNKRASYPFGIISLAHAPVNVTDFSIGKTNCQHIYVRSCITYNLVIIGTWRYDSRSSTSIDPVIHLSFDLFSCPVCIFSLILITQDAIVFECLGNLLS
jgi:hypothetical protein